MSVTVASYKNFVGGEWVDAAEGGVEQIVNPATGDDIAEVPKGTETDVDRGGPGRQAGLPEWHDTTPAERADPAQARRRDRREHRGAGALESQNVGKPLS